MSEADKVKQLVEDVFGSSSDDEKFERGIKKRTVKSKKLSVIQSETEDLDIESKNKKVAKNATKKPEVEVKNAVVSAAKNEDENGKKGARKVAQKVTKKNVKKNTNKPEVEVKNALVSDFDIMLKERKIHQRNKRKRVDIDIMNDNDRYIGDLIQQMKRAANEDRELNTAKKTAFKKLKLLPTIISQLGKQDLQAAFVELGILPVFTDWLAPLPDRSLPSLKIRESILNVLLAYPKIDPSSLKESEIAQAVRYLHKHPKETKENRVRTGQLITSWSRAILNLDSQSDSEEEREIRQVSRKRSRTEEGEEEGLRKRPRIDLSETSDDDEQTNLTPCDVRSLITISKNPKTAQERCLRVAASFKRRKATYKPATLRI